MIDECYFVVLGSIIPKVLPPVRLPIFNIARSLFV